MPEDQTLTISPQRHIRWTPNDTETCQESERSCWFLGPTRCLLVLFPDWKSSTWLVAWESEHLYVDPQTKQHKRRHHHDVLGTIGYRRSTDHVPVHAVRWCLATRQTVKVKIRLIIVWDTQECLLGQHLQLHAARQLHTTSVIFVFI